MQCLEDGQVFATFRCKGQTQVKLVMFDNCSDSSPPAAQALAAGKMNQREVIYNVDRLLTDMKSCIIRRDLEWGKRIHIKAVESRHDMNMYVATALIRMYGKCGSVLDARRMFDSIQKPDVMSWSALLHVCVDNGDGLATLEFFSRMKACGCKPNSVSYIAALRACASLAGKRESCVQNEWLKRGKVIHSEIDCDLDIFLQSTLTHMYAKCGSMVDARRVFESIPKPNLVCWNFLLRGYVQNGDGITALDMFSKMKACGCEPNFVTCITALKACTSLVEKGDSGKKGECLKWVRKIHSSIGRHLNIFVQNTLIDMYAKSGSIVEARCVFDSIQKPDVVSWNVILLGYLENGEALTTLELFTKMKTFGVLPASLTYVAALKACTFLAARRYRGGQSEWLRRGRDIHSEIESSKDVFVMSTLIDMYAKCGNMVYARRVFESIEMPDVVCWSALLLGYAENEEGLTALELFSKMKVCGCAPNSVTYVAALKACKSLAFEGDGCGQDECSKRCRELHSEIGCNLNIFVQNTLIDLYTFCGSMVDARGVFDTIEKPDVVSWTALIQGYAENGEGLITLKLFSEMQASGCAPDSVTYAAALKACSLVGALNLGRKFHAEISIFTAPIVTCLVDFYAKCGSIVEARKVFDAQSQARDVSTWTSLLTGYGSFGDTVSVFNLFEAMQDQGFQPNGVTFLCILSCCSHAGLVGKAREYFEAMPVKYGVTPTMMHYNCMVDILGRANQLTEAITLLQKMPHKPDAVTWKTLLGACRKWKNAEIGRYVFQCLMEMDKQNAPAYSLMWEELENREEDPQKILGIGF